MDIRSFFAPKGGTKPKEANKNGAKSQDDKKTEPVKKQTKTSPGKRDRSRSGEKKKEEKLKSKKSDRPKESADKKSEARDNKSDVKKESRNKKSQSLSDDDFVVIEDEDEPRERTEKRKKEDGEMDEKKKGEMKKSEGKTSSKKERCEKEGEEEEESPIQRKRNKQVLKMEDKEEEKGKKKDRKKKHRLFESESEEEEDPFPKKVKKKKKDPVVFIDESDDEDKPSNRSTLDAFVINTPTPKKKKEDKKKTETKTSVNVADFFSSGNITRVERPVSTKRKSSEVDRSGADVEMHDDEDFLQTLKQIDDQQQHKRAKLEPETSPTKPSLAKKLADKAKNDSTTKVVKTSPEKLSKGDNNNNNSSKKHSPIKVIETPTPPKSKPKTPNKTSPVDDKKNTSSDSGTPSIQRKNSYRSYLNREGPTALGSKEIPVGEENCLEGLTFVMTGVYESIERDEAKSLIERHGGKVTTSISKKTDFIVVGRDAGESKLNKASQFATKQLDEDSLFNLIRTKPGKKSKYVIQAEESVKKEKLLEKKTSMDKTKTTSVSKPAENSAPSTSSNSIGRSNSKNQSEPVLLWVDKHKPVSMKSIIGQQGDKSNAKKLFHWLNCWHKNRASGTKPSGKFFNKNDDGSGFKAALLSGPPGVGKTTTATLVCKEAGFSYVELNASDTRSKKSLQTEVAEALSNQTLVDFMGEKTIQTEGQKHCLIMDEVDGMAGNADRGGLQELVQLIKGSKIPVICICNDRNSSKMRTLANYCFDLRFYKPRLEQIKGAMMSLAFKEGLKIAPPAMNEIILAANQDIRQVIHNLSMWSVSDRGLSYEQAKRDSKSAQKDMKIGPFDVCRKVFIGGEETANMTIHDKSNLFFNDYSIAPLFVQENYLSVTPYGARGDVKTHLRLLAKTADSICDGDLTDRLIRREGVWSLLPLQAMYASVIPGELMRGGIQQMVAFPSWLGKNSTTNKTDRLLAELSMHMRLNICGDKRAMCLDYLPVFRKCLTDPLVNEGGGGVTRVIQLMDDYDIVREDFDNIMDVTKWPDSPDPLSLLDSKTKAAFTRTYNKENHKTPYVTGAAPKKKKGRGGGGEGDEDALLKMEGDEEEGGGAEGESEEEGEELEADAMIKAKKKTDAKGRGKKETTEKTSTSKGGKGKGRGKGKS